VTPPTPPAVPAPLGAWLLAVRSLVVREIRRFYRQTSRVVGAFLQPLLFWFFIAAGLQGSFHAPDAPGLSYGDYALPGILLMILMFTGIFSTITIIEDRRDGFLQGVLVAPVAPSALVTGKMLGGALLGITQAALLLPLVLTPLTSLRCTGGGLAWLLAAFLLVGCLFTAGGVLMAWPMRSTQGYHALMSVLLLPLWLFSGAVFPAAGATNWLAGLMQLNPLAHALALLRHGFAPAGTPIPWPAVWVVLVVTAGLWATASLVCARPRE